MTSWCLPIQGAGVHLAECGGCALDVWQILEICACTKASVADNAELQGRLECFDLTEVLSLSLSQLGHDLLQVSHVLLLAAAVVLRRQAVLLRLCLHRAHALCCGIEHFVFLLALGPVRGHQHIKDRLREVAGRP